MIRMLNPDAPERSDIDQFFQKEWLHFPASRKKDNIVLLSYNHMGK